MTFMLALDLLAHGERATLEFVMRKAQESGTPFLSLFSPPELIAVAKKAGFTQAQFVSAENLYQRYFAHRTDGLRAENAEGFLVGVR